MSIRKWFVNVAISFDSKISLQNQSVNISSDEDWEVVHNFRNSIAAIVVGSNTVKIDNPSLLTRVEYVTTTNQIQHPVRVILDKSGSCSSNSLVFKNQDLSPTIWITKSNKNISGIKKINETETSKIIIQVNKFLDDINKSGDVMVEGGAKTITNFINSGMLEKIRVYRSPIILPKGIPLFAEQIHKTLVLQNIKKLGPGIEEIYTIN